MNSEQCFVDLRHACIDYFLENEKKILKCFEDMTEEDIWKRPNTVSNSLGNQILHLCGNIRQYVIACLGDQPDIRERDLEFSTDGGIPKRDLLIKFKQIIQDAVKIIENTDGETFLKTHKVQGYTHTGTKILVHATEHLSYHSGQIAFWTKQLKGNDLGFYDGIDLNQPKIN